eukprot:1157646-Pelagomonas_calceolata.AAC.8
MFIPMTGNLLNNGKTPANADIPMLASLSLCALSCLLSTHQSNIIFLDLSHEILDVRHILVHLSLVEVFVLLQQVNVLLRCLQALAGHMQQALKVLFLRPHTSSCHRLRGKGTLTQALHKVLR